MGTVHPLVGLCFGGLYSRDFTLYGEGLLLKCRSGFILNVEYTVGTVSHMAGTDAIAKCRSK